MPSAGFPAAERYIRAPAVGLAVAALLVALPYLLNVAPGQFIVGHDWLVPLVDFKALEWMSTLREVNGGFVQGINPPMAFTTSLLYGLPLGWGVPERVVQAAGMTMTFAIVVALAMLGFDRLLRQWGRDDRSRRIDAALLALAYVVAPHTLIAISNGTFWIVSVALAVGVIPLYMHFLLRCFGEDSGGFSWAPVAGASLCAIVIAWSIFFIFPAALMGAAALVLRGWPSRSDLGKAAAIVALVLGGSAPSLYGLYLSGIDPGWHSAVDMVWGNAAYGSIRGGVLTGFLEQATWLIYNFWQPRLVLGFPSHFSNAAHVALAFSSVAVLAALPLVQRGELHTRRYLFVAVMFLLAVFFVKGASEPLGFLFEAVLTRIPGGGLIRTPDTKFGVFVVAALAMASALALAQRRDSPRWFQHCVRAVMCLSIAYHALPLLDGRAIFAQRSELAPSYAAGGNAISLTPAEERIIAALRRDDQRGVMMLPPASGMATARRTGVFAYRIVVEELTPNPFFYADEDAIANNAATRAILRSAVYEGRWNRLPELGVGFVLADHNVLGERANYRALYDAVRTSPAWTRVVDMGGYELYRLADRFAQPAASANGEGGKDLLARAQVNTSWALFDFAADASRGPASLVLQKPYNKYWRLVALPAGCTLGAALCVTAAVVGGARLLPPATSSPDIATVWLLGPHEAAPRMVAIFLPQVVMYMLLALSLSFVALCLYLQRRARR